VWQSYAECGEIRSAVGSGMQHLGISPGSAVGLYSGGWVAGWLGVGLGNWAAGQGSIQWLPAVLPHIAKHRVLFH
jgi:hypothetical protein